MLEVLTASPQPLRLVEISKRVGLPVATTFRLLAALSDMGYVRRDEGDRYHLQYGLFRLADSVHRTNYLRAIARPILVRLVSEFGETVQFGELRGAEVVVHERVMAADQGRETLNAFEALPTAAHATALGKLLLAYGGEQSFFELYGGRRLRSYTRQTITDPGHLRKTFEYIRAKRACCDFEEAVPGLVSHAAPIFDREGKAVFAISVSGWTSRISRSFVPKVMPRLHQAADEISRQLIHRILQSR
ncbi:hypothetical protein XI00_25765 [Bradyrhizobium sp. CCBAU 21359]|nr:hypothetical protein [Bradyrhizobium sp. CCBAU 21359]